MPRLLDWLGEGSGEMSSVLINIGVVLALILLEAVFVAAEIALVSLRDGQVKTLSERGGRGAKVARLVSDPNRFLATVQIAITLTALLSSAFGAVTLSDQAKDGFVSLGMSPGLAKAIGLIGVTLIISFVTLIIGELVPKRLALQRAEGTALLVSPFLNSMATLARPVIWLLSRTTDLVVGVLGGDPTANREAITQQELRDLVAAHEALSLDERRLIDEVFAAGDRQISEVMVPRTEVDFLDASTTISRAAKMVMGSAHSRFPVIDQNQDDVVGFVHLRDLMDHQPAARATTLADVVREVKRLPGSKNVLAALSEMRREGSHMAIVVDEYGGTDGIVTLEDLIEEVIGDIRDEYDQPAKGLQQLATGEIEVDGLLNLDEFAEKTGIELPEGPFETVAGFMMSALGRLPVVGDVISVDGGVIEIAELEGRRVTRMRVTLRHPKPMDEFSQP